MLNEQYSPVATPQQFTVARLTAQSMPQVADLLTATQNSLPDDKKHFIKPQSLGDLYRHVSNGLPVLGAVDNTTGQIAAVLLMTPAEKAYLGKNLADYPSKIMESGAAVIQCVAVHPDFQGKGLMDKILHGAELLAAKEHMTDLVAKVATVNNASNKGFLKAAFMVAAEGTDEKLGYDVAYLKKTCEALAPTAFPIFNAPQHANDEFATFSCY